MQFETSASQYAWLNKTIAAGNVIRFGKAVIYNAFTFK